MKRLRQCRPRKVIGMLVWIISSGVVLADPDKAFEHIYDTMDRYHQTLDVYSDDGMAGNHFVMRGKMNSAGGDDLVSLDDRWTTSFYTGYTCIRNRLVAAGGNWGGWYLMNGVLSGEDRQPSVNWGTYANAGMDLTGAHRLTFWARGENGGEQVEFFAFGVGRDAVTGYPTDPYPDSSPKVTLGLVTLSTNWTQYTINLVGRDVSYVLGGFGWVTEALRNGNQDVTFYLDEIRYDKSRFDDPRFLVSYETIPSSGDDFDAVMRNAGFTYDNALALLALLCGGTEGDVRRAGLIADALVYASEHDRYFTDGRLRNAYQGGDLVLFPGWRPNGKDGTTRMAGWWSVDGSNWYEDKEQVSTHTGNVAWAIIALLSYYDSVHQSKYVDAAKVLAEWIETQTKDTRGVGGYMGGYAGWEASSNNPQGQTRLLWKSTEHNLDVYVAFTRLYKVTGNTEWMERASHARAFVEAMWDQQEGHFWTGTLDDGVIINKSCTPLDIQAWVVMAMNSYYSALTWSEQQCAVEADGFWGFDFNNDKDGVWFEGTAHMAVAYQISGQTSKSDSCLVELRKAQASATHANGKGLVAASHDRVSTGFSWEYYSRLHIGATAWYIFAERGYNPYWGTRTVGQIMHDWNSDGVISIVGDVSRFVGCVYRDNCPSWPQENLLQVGDCNHDGIISIIGDVPCFVDCVYFGHCPE